MEEAGSSTRMCCSDLVSIHEPRRRKPLACEAGLEASGEARWGDDGAEEEQADGGRGGGCGRRTKEMAAVDRARTETG